MTEPYSLPRERLVLSSAGPNRLRTASAILSRSEDILFVAADLEATSSGDRRVLMSWDSSPSSFKLNGAHFWQRGEIRAPPSLRRVNKSFSAIRFTQVAQNKALNARYINPLVPSAKSARPAISLIPFLIFFP
jgi:hypothetical protein